MLILKVVQTVSAFHVSALLEIVKKIFVFGIATSYRFYNDGFLFLDVKNNISKNNYIKNIIIPLKQDSSTTNIDIQSMNNS